ncbi:polyribonucleotide nucleotidyltransferase [bacterium]|nr:polyribonucleotide nucleotidyltransferase [bacterium]
MSVTKIEQREGLNFVETIAHVPFGEGTELELSTGKVAKQANGAVLAKIGGTVVLAAAVMSDKPTDKDFFPLMVDYREKFYAAGRIPGSFFKREGRPGDKESLRARLIDRTLRPLFPKGFKYEVMVFITILALDQEHPAELVAMCAASAAIHISDIPFKKPIAGVRVGRLDGEFVVNPSFEQIEKLDMNLIVAGHREAINMVEAGSKEVSEADIVAGLELAHSNIRTITEGIDALRDKTGKPKIEYVEPEADADLVAKVEKLAAPHIKEIQATHEKKARDNRFKQAIEEILEELGEDYAERAGEVASIFGEIDETAMRRRVLAEGIRADGRKPTEIRPIWSEIDTLPSVHGSAIFTRGQTQALAVCTLGTTDDQQMVDEMSGVGWKRFYLHYNFPSFSVGEARPPRGPGRREIGHGALAERAVEAILPDKENFPYTIRLVVEILESNGSSSMATVCSSSMALMDAGVPVSRPVGGIAMGLIAGESDDELAILSDIQGIEDHCGDMDFKVCGTTEGITALQMDIKIDGVTSDMLARALDQARAGRLHILDKMNESIGEHREELKPHTPRMTILKVPTEKIREIIGGGGSTIRGIQEETGARIDIEDDGTVYVTATSGESSDAAIQMIDEIVREIEPGEVITGKVFRVIDSGAIVQLGPKKDGMIHISELEHHRVDKVEDVVNVGDEVTVKVLDVDKARGRIRLSRKALIEAPEGAASSDEGGNRGRGDRGDRGNRGPRGGGSRSGGDDRRQRRPRPPRKDRDGE